MNKINNVSEVKTNTSFGTAFLIIAFSVIAFLILYTIDLAALHSRYYNKWTYPAQCDYIAPNGFKILYCEDYNKYVVAVNEWPDYYLYSGAYRIQTMYSTIAMPALFDDSCEAKGYLKGYIEQIQPRIKCK